MASDHSGEKPNSIGAVPIRQRSKPRKTLVIRPGGNAPDGVEIIGALKSGPLACTQRIAPSSPAAAVAMAISRASSTVCSAAPSPNPR